MRSVVPGSLAAALTVAAALTYSAAASAGSDAPPAKGCVTAQEARVHAAGDSSEQAAPKFSKAFYKRTLSLDTSIDGIDGRELPISIEEVCSVPKALQKQAVQLSGADGVALVYSSTSVWQGRTQLRGAAATNAIAGADTAVLKARLANPRHWRADEDGSSVPTFVTRRIDITD